MFFKLLNNSNRGCDCRNNMTTAIFSQLAMRSMRYFIYNEVFDKEVFSLANCELKQHEIEPEFREKILKLSLKILERRKLIF